MNISSLCFLLHSSNFLLFQVRTNQNFKSTITKCMSWTENSYSSLNIFKKGALIPQARNNLKIFSPGITITSLEFLFSYYCISEILPYLLYTQVMNNFHQTNCTISSHLPRKFLQLSLTSSKFGQFLELRILK